MITHLSPNKSNNALLALHLAIILACPLAMLSGLFMAPWIAIMMLLTVYLVGIDIRDATENFGWYEHAVILWVIASCLWAASPIESFFTSSRLLLILILTQIIHKKRHLIQIKHSKLLIGLLVSVVATIFIFFIESQTNGMIIKILRNIFQPYKVHHFELFWLDRGSSIFSIFSWAPIYLLLNSRQFLKAILTYIAVLVTLIFSDSDAALLAFILAGVTCLALYLSSMGLSKLLSLCVVAYIFAMPVFSKIQDPYYLDDTSGKLPISYVHRLFIWKYSANQSMDNLFLGKGIDASRHIEPTESDMVHYDGFKLSPFPRYPHNNVMQVWLELGLVGLAIFASYLWNILARFREMSKKNYAYGCTIHAMFINYFVIGMISFNLWQSWWIMVILFMSLIMNVVRDE